MSEKYYTAPSEKIFDQIKLGCLATWARYHNEEQLGYMISKMGRVLKMPNVSDNYMSMIGMFDIENTLSLFKILPIEALDYIREALLSVENDMMVDYLDSVLDDRLERETV